MLELNKDWKGYGLIGGKVDRHEQTNYEITLFREIEEELGIPRERVLLSPLTKRPLNGYGLSGGAGTLSYYPCMLYLAQIKNPIKIRPYHRWFTEDEFKSLRNSDEPRLLINDVYLDFIFKELEGGLKGLNYSSDISIDSGLWYHEAREILMKNKIWIIPILALLTALIELIKVLLNP